MDRRKKACLAIVIALSGHQQIKRRCWVKEWLKKRERLSHVALLREISITDAEDFRNYFRMDQQIYDKLLTMVTPFLRRQDTVMRKSISVTERLSLTLRYLATGRNFEDLKFSALMSPASISVAVLETCEVLAYVLQSYIKVYLLCYKTCMLVYKTYVLQFTLHPNVHNHDDFFTSSFRRHKKIGSKFLNVLEVDTISIIVSVPLMASIQKPAHSGLLFFNYKGFYSIVLMALVNSRKEFIMVDVGINGRVSDGGVLFYSKFGEQLEKNNLMLPESAPLPNTDEKFPYVFVADEAFALRTDMLKPYPQKLLNEERYEYNKRLSRARATVENTFGILTSRFGVFQKSIMLEPDKSGIVVRACCYLHNFLSKQTNNHYQINEGGNEVNPLPNLNYTTRKNSSNAAKEIREKFCRYFNTKGKLN